MEHRTPDALIDSHCHLDFSCFERDREQVLSSCASLNISSIVLPGTQASQWQNQITLTQSALKTHLFPQLKFSLGLHPYFLEQYQAEHLVQLRALLIEHRNHVVALGEIGLDRAIDIDWQLQLKVFSAQVQFAKELSLPIILHHRKSHNELIQVLKTEKFTDGGIVHAFSGSLQQASTYIDLGFKLGIGGSITYERANKTRQAVSQLPLSSLVLETDAPDMPLSGKQGMRNTPENLPDIFNCLVELRTESPDVLRQALYQNTLDALNNMT